MNARNVLTKLLALAVAFTMAMSIAGVALAEGENTIVVTISGEAVVKAEDATTSTPGDGAVTPNGGEDENGYTYTNGQQEQTNVYLDGEEEDLVIEKGQGEVGTQNTIPNEDVINGSGNPDNINDNNIYLREYDEQGGWYATDPGAFYDEAGNPILDGLPVDVGVDEDIDLIKAILEANGKQYVEGSEYLIEIGQTVISGDKMVQEVLVQTPEGEIIGYEVTLDVEATRSDKIFKADGEVVISNNTKNIILAIDITGSMANNLAGSSIPSNQGGELNENSRWSILKKAASEFIEIVYGVDDDGNATNENVALSLVVYNGGNDGTNPPVARTITLDLGGKVFTKDDIDELLEYFVGGLEGTTRADLRGDGMKNTTGTNTQAGYMETKALAQELHGAGVEYENIHVVFMTDGEANTYYNSSGNSTQYSGSSANITTAGQKAADAAVDLLKLGVSLHNIAINNTDTNIGTYMNPEQNEGYFNQQLTAAQGTLGDVDFNMFDNVEYTWAKTADDIINTYKAIAMDIVNSALVAEKARIIDVVPAGYDIYFADGNPDNLRVIGKDTQGNTIIEWYIGNLVNGKEYSTSYFLIPNMEDYAYGTAYTNDSAILFATPIANGGDEVAIVLDRPAALLGPSAFDDTVEENYDNGFSFNLLNGTNSGASGGSSYTLLKDSNMDDNKMQAVGTNVSDTKVVGVRNAMIGGDSVGVTENGGVFTFENAYIRVRIAPDGTVTYEHLQPWNDEWGTELNITFDYDISFEYNPGNVTMARPLAGNDRQPGTASAKASITLAEPTGQPDSEIPTGEPEEIPLGVPHTGGMGLAGAAAILMLSGLATTTGTLARRRKENEEGA